MAYGYECYGEGRIPGSWIDEELIKEVKLDYNQVAMAKWNLIIQSRERETGVAITVEPALYEQMIQCERETSKLLPRIGSGPRMPSRVEDDVGGGSIDARGAESSNLN